MTENMRAGSFSLMFEKLLCNVFGGALVRKVWAKHFFPTTLVIACKELKTQK